MCGGSEAVERIRRGSMSFRPPPHEYYGVSPWQQSTCSFFATFAFFAAKTSESSVGIVLGFDTKDGCVVVGAWLLAGWEMVVEQLGRG